MIFSYAHLSLVSCIIHPLGYRKKKGTYKGSFSVVCSFIGYQVTTLFLPYSYPIIALFLHYSCPILALLLHYSCPIIALFLP